MAMISLSVNCAAIAKDSLTTAEKEEIEKQKNILDEITQLYAERALQRPADFTACVREMFAMRRSNKCRDKFTHYSTPEEVKQFDDAMAGKFGGVGIEITQKGDMVVVVAAIEGTPAERAGIKANDIILKVNGKETESVDEAASLIRGKPGTKVTLTVFRQKTKKELTFTLTRETIVVESVKWRLSSADPKIGVIKINRFDHEVPEKFAKAVIGLDKEGAKRVIIDLRNNPGGYLDSALAMLGLFAQKKDIILTVRHRHSEEVITLSKGMPLRAWKSHMDASQALLKDLNKDSLKDISVVILVNNGSASASEIFAGTMKDWGYPIVGEKSFGKGVGQEIISLSDGSRLALTTFEFLAGNGKAVIRDKGVKPTIEVKVPEENSRNKKEDKDDLQLMKAIEVLESCKKGIASVYKCARK